MSGQHVWPPDLCLRIMSVSIAIVMRKDAVYTVLLNATLFKGMKCSYAPQDQRYLRFSTFDRSGVPTHYNLRVSVAFDHLAPTDQC